MIYFTSDTHFTHQNISGPGTWETGHRGFTSLEEHDQAMLAMLNQAGKYDTIYFLGDFVFNRKHPWQLHQVLSQVECESIHFILGNHDPLLQKMFDMGDWWTEKWPSSFAKIEDLTPMKEIRVEGQSIVLCHYGLEVWNHSHKGTWHLHGHSHDTLPPKGLRTDVSPETAMRLFGQYRMFTMQDLKDIFSNRDPYFGDHHNKNTQ